MENNKLKIKVGKVFIYGQTEHTIKKFDNDSVVTKKHNGHHIIWNRIALEMVLVDPKYYE